MVKNISFDFTTTSYFKEDYQENLSKLKQELKLMKASDYNDERASLNLVDDKQNLTLSKNLAAKYSDISMLVVVGIGGSNLGTLAVYEALYGRNANEFRDKKVYFADTVDSFMLEEILNKMREEFSNGGKVLLNVISKSGGTTETLANFQVLYSELIKHTSNPKDFVVFTTDKGSELDSFAQDFNGRVLHIPGKVGGRYSVFSAVGLFPLAVLGVDVEKLIQGAKDMKVGSFAENLENNPAMMSALCLFNSTKHEKDIVDTFFFILKFESIGKWYRQLMGESLGKETNRDKTKILSNKGLTPTVSIGSVDLHSMAQLYLAGTKNKFHIFIETRAFPYLKIEDDMLANKSKSLIKGKSTSEIMDAILIGTQKAFLEKNIPYYRVIFEEISEYTIGAFLQMKMIEMMFLGALFDVNPFDQPNVEEYKVHTKRVLGDEK